MECTKPKELGSGGPGCCRIVRAPGLRPAPDHPASCPGPAAPAAALWVGGDHGTDLAPHQQAGRPAPAALPGLAHCLRFHHLPPVERQSLSRAPVSARVGEEQLRHRGTGKEGEGQGGVEETTSRLGDRGGRRRWPDIDKSLKVIHPNVTTVLAPLVPVFIRIQRNGKEERNLFYT